MKRYLILLTLSLAVNAYTFDMTNASAKWYTFTNSGLPETITARTDGTNTVLTITLYDPENITNGVYSRAITNTIHRPLESTNKHARRRVFAIGVGVGSGATVAVIVLLKALIN